MLKLLIFDLDGTLADTSRDITDSINFALEPFVKKPYTVEEIKAMVGSGITSLIRSLTLSDDPAKTGNSASDRFEKAVKRFLDYYSAHLLDKTVAYPGVKETLLKLGHYKKIVLSNKREGYSIKILEGLALLNSLDAVFGSDSLSEKKPSPVPVLEILDRFAVSGDEAVIIGDSNFDIEAGRAAGLRSIAVTYGFRSRETLKDADFMIDGFEELLIILPDIK
jgi:phosphoglycolate phosphatase